MSDLDAVQTSPEARVAPPTTPNLGRHLIAAALSAIVPGVGQFYLGERRKGLVVLVVLIVVSIGFWPLRLPRSYQALLFLVWVLLLLSLYAVYEALLGRDLTSSGRFSWWWILAVIPLQFIGLNLLFTSLLFGSGFQTAKNLGLSMQPTLANKERFLYDTACYRSQPKRRGDVVVFQYRDSLFIKRIAAVGGDTIEGKGQQILLNGQPLNDSSPTDAFGPVTVLSGKYFVLGDNLDMSFDSRTPSFGLVDENSIVGKALYSYQFTNIRSLDQGRQGRNDE